MAPSSLQESTDLSVTSHLVRVLGFNNPWTPEQAQIIAATRTLLGRPMPENLAIMIRNYLLGWDRSLSPAQIIKELELEITHVN